MELKSYILICVIAYVAVVHNAEAGCKDDLMAANKACFDSYNTYLANLGQSGADSSQIMVKLCTDEGKAAWSCLKPLLDKCQELKGDARFQVFSILETSGGCDVMNPSGGGGMMGGGSGGVCLKAQQECMSVDENEEEANESVVNAPTQFNKFQEEIKTICGQMKNQFECMKKYEKECPNMETQFKQMFDMARNSEKTMNPDKPFPSFESQKEFVMNQCPKFPDDFSTNACLTDNLKTDVFIDCYNNATGGSDTKLTCNQYQTAYDCVGEALKTCGDKHKNSYTATMNFYL
ncbi:uncharacterized protein LOC132720628, partial [Ruditapes philippinarum]|uniref:uncharacterized protein LOC132720628 n=1 Tax=Ruditapes philippinarum TaxID=129788 RepID=UPI00295AA1F5